MVPARGAPGDPGEDAYPRRAEEVTTPSAEVEAYTRVLDADEDEPPGERSE